MNIAPISEPNTMMPAHGRHPEDRPRGDVEVVERIGGSPLSDHEADERGHADDREPEHQPSAQSGTAAKLIARITAPTSDDRQDAAEVVDRLRGLVDVARG